MLILQNETCLISIQHKSPKSNVRRAAREQNHSKGIGMINAMHFLCEKIFDVEKKVTHADDVSTSSIDVEARSVLTRDISSTLKENSIIKLKISLEEFLTASKFRTPVTAIPKMDSRFALDPSESILLDVTICVVGIIGL